MKRTLAHTLLILVFAGIVLFTNLGVPRLWDRDEPRNAGCTVEMLQAGDWVVPVFNAELRTHKPILLYWLMMASYALFGVGEFGARFASAALGMGTVLLTYAIGRRLFDSTAGLLAALVLATALMFGVASRAATPDAPLIFFATLATAFYVFGTFRAGPDGGEVRNRETFFPTSRWMTVGMYVAMGVAVLAKGPIGVVLPSSVIGMFMLLMRMPTRQPAVATLPDSPEKPGLWNSLRAMIRPWIPPIAEPLARLFRPSHFLRTCLAMRLGLAVAIVLLIAAPWYIWVGLRTDGEWLRGFFLDHNLRRATTTMEDHNGSIFFYPGMVMVGFFPWSAFFIPMLIEIVTRIRQNDARRTAYTFLCCWVGVYIGLFSIAQTKLPSYITPMYPALALLAADYLRQWLAGRQKAALGWTYAALAVPLVVGIPLAVGFVVAAGIYLPGEEVLGPVVGGILAVGAVVCLWLYRRRGPRAAVIAYAALALGFTTALLAWVPVRIDRHRQTEVLLEVIGRSDRSTVAALDCLEPSWVFYGRRPIREFPSARFDEAVRLLDTQPSAVMIITRPTYERFAKRWPARVRVLAEVPYFLQQTDLLLLGNVRDSSPPPARTAVGPSDVPR